MTDKKDYEDNLDAEMYQEQKVNAPIKNINEKWKLIPSFLRLRGLFKQHIDSFNYFINVQMKNMVRENNEIRCDNPSHRDFFMRFDDIYVEKPIINEDAR